MNAIYITMWKEKKNDLLFFFYEKFLEIKF